MVTDILSSLNKGGSGLNIRDLTTSLVAAEIQPKQSVIDRRIAATETSISALGQLRAGLNKLGNAITALSVTPILSARSSASGTTVNVTDKSKLVEGSTDLNVLSLASRQVLEFEGFAGADTAIGAGDMTVEIGVWVDPDTNEFVANPDKPTQTLTIPTGATLQDLADALNGLEGVSARIVDKGDGTFSLGVVSELGAANGLRFSVTEDVSAPGLAVFDTATSIATRQIQSAADAMMEVDGLTVFRPTNTVTDLVPGATLTLSATGPGVVTIARDRQTASDNLEFLVTSVNETLSLLQSLSSRGANGAPKGGLAGDNTTDALVSRIQTLLSSPISGHGERDVFLADLGVATERNGTLRFDKARFNATFDDTPAMVDALFIDNLSTSNAGVSIVGAPLSAGNSGKFSFLRPGGTGPATIGDAGAISTSLGDGRTRFVPLGGPLSGTVVTARDGIEGADIQFGKSFLSLLQDTLDDALSFSGGIAAREKQLSNALNNEQDALIALEAKATKLEDRYLNKFTAMEVAISQLKSTGTYLTNLVAQWNKST